MAPERHRSGRSQRGETLIESLLAIAILSIVAAAAYTGLQVAIRSSAEHRELAAAEALLRSAAERIQDPSTPYVPRAGCPGAGTYTELPSRSGYGTVRPTVRFWTPGPAITDAASAVSFAAKGDTGDCPGVDPGLQQIELSVTTPSGLVETLQITKRAAT